MHWVVIYVITRMIQYTKGKAYDCEQYHTLSVFCVRNQCCAFMSCVHLHGIGEEKSDSFADYNRKTIDFLTEMRMFTELKGRLGENGKTYLSGNQDNAHRRLPAQ